MAKKTGKKKSKKKDTTRKKSSARKKSGAHKTGPATKSSGRKGKAGSRSLWSGNIRLALVSVPVKLYPATSTGARIRFHQVHEPSGKRVRHEKVVPGIGPVDSQDIVKGYDLGRGNYVLIDPEDIDELKLEERHTINLIQFVEQREIDPIWFDRPYYVVADDENAEEAYVVIREALRRSGRIGLGQFVMRGREHIGAIKPCGRGLLLETLRFADEVREAARFFAEIPDEEPDEELLDLANELIDRKSAPFSPDSFNDRYAEAVRDLIERKAKDRPVQVGEEELESGGAEVIDLVDALKKSVRSPKKGGNSSDGRRRATKRKAS